MAGSRVFNVHLFTEMLLCSPICRRQLERKTEVMAQERQDPFGKTVDAHRVHFR